MQASPDTSAQHRAIEVARQLLAIGQWLDYLNTLIVIHMLMTGIVICNCLDQVHTYYPDYNVVVYPA